MAEEIRGIVIKSFEGHMETDDGSQILLKFGAEQGEFVLAASTEDVPSILKGLVFALASTNKRETMSSQARPTSSVDWTEVGISARGPVISFRLRDSGFLDFQLDETTARVVLEALQVGLDGSTPPSPGNLQS